MLSLVARPISRDRIANEEQDENFVHLEMLERDWTLAGGCLKYRSIDPLVIPGCRTV